MSKLTKSEITRMPATELKSLASRGIIEVMNAQPIPTRVEETPEYKKHKHLAGRSIHLSEASRKYDLALSTISQWVKRGVIKKLGNEKNRVMLDEAYIAYAVEVMKGHPESKGKWLFDAKGLPYTATTIRAR